MSSRASVPGARGAAPAAEGELPRLGDVADRVRGVLSRNLELDVPSFEADLFETGVLDSLTFVDLLVELEEEFSVRIDLDGVDLEAFRSVVRIAALVHGRMSPGGQGSAEAGEKPWDR